MTTGHSLSDNGMTTVPRLSIGLPVYNGERYLGEAIESVLDQTYEDYELIISDNASTDQTASICKQFRNQDSRIRYFRQAKNIGLAPNHNFVISQARGKFFKFAHHDDLSAPELVARCVDALDRHPEAVLAYTGSAVIDSAGMIQQTIDHSESTSLPRAPDRFRSMLDGWEDWYGGVVRLKAMRAIAPHDSYHFADRVYPTELALHGTFFMVPECLFFRRSHVEQAGRQADLRGRCTILDPRRGKRIMHPVARLYSEYLWGYVRAIRHAPLTPSEKRECYGTLARWAGTRFIPVLNRARSKKGLMSEVALDGAVTTSVSDAVARTAE